MLKSERVFNWTFTVKKRHCVGGWRVQLCRINSELYVCVMVLPPVPAAWPVWAVAPPFVSIRAATPLPARWTVGGTAAGTPFSPEEQKHTNSILLLAGCLKQNVNQNNRVLVYKIHHFVFGKTASAQHAKFFWMLSAVYKKTEFTKWLRL